MNILVVSDSHGNVDALEAACLRVQPDLLLHLGDHYSDLEALQQRLPALPCLGVRGNCDGPGPEETRVLTRDGHVILMTHGHRQGVKLGLHRLWFTAREANAELVLFGHTHTPLQEQKGNITFLNPGSIGRGWPPTFGLVTLAENYLRCEILENAT